MTVRVMLGVPAQDRCAFEQTIGAFCFVATFAHLQGNYGRRDLAVELAARLALGLALEPNQAEPHLELRAERPVRS